MNHLIEFGVCALADSMKFIIIYKYIIKMLSAFLDFQIWCCTVRAHFKENFQKENTPKQLKWATEGSKLVC